MKHVTACPLVLDHQLLQIQLLATRELLELCQKPLVFLSHSHSHAHPVRRMNVLEGDIKRSEIVIYTGTYVGIKIQKKPLFLNY